MNNYYIALVSAAFITSFSLGGEARADAGNTTFLEHDASHCEMIRAMSGRIPYECLTKRGFRQVPNDGEVSADEHIVSKASKESSKPSPDAPAGVTRTSTNEADARSRPAQGSPSVLAMQIPFAFDSAFLKPAAFPILEEVASALRHEFMRDYIVAIEGHADAVGSTTYNLELSIVRAQAVQRHLNERYGIPLYRIPARGKGEAEPWAENDPDAGVNRRVEFEPLDVMVKHTSGG